MQSNYTHQTIPYAEQNLYSVSKLKTYSLCSKYYEYQYELGLREYSFSYSTVLGSVCHNSLERHHLTGEQLLQCINEVFLDTLISSKVVSEDVDKNIIHHLIEYNKIVQMLYYKASADYKGSDAIRTLSGSIPKNPSQTTEWKNQLESKGGHILKEDIDNYCNKYALTQLEFNVSDLYCECYKWLSVYKKPEEEKEVLAVEFGISHVEGDQILNPCHIEGNNNLLRCYLDKVGIYSSNNVEGIGIIDYKTSASEMNEMHVANNEQLYIYVFAYEQVTGNTVTFIGIENIKFQNLQLVPVDRDKLKSIVDNFFFRIKMIEQKLFYKEHSPDNMYSKCLNSYGKVCPYLNQCYPDTYRQLNKECAIEAMLKSL